MKAKYYCVLISVFVVLLMRGYGSDESRRQNDLKEIQQKFGHARNPIGQTWGTNILSALSSANAATLERPRCASATMGRDASGEYRMFVFWLQSNPTVDSVELQLGGTNVAIPIAISNQDLEDEAKASEVSVVMTASWIWHRPDSIWSKIENVDDVASLKVRLVRLGKPETDWNPVAFFRLDHWMGSKEIKPVTSGPSSIKTP